MTIDTPLTVVVDRASVLPPPATRPTMYFIGASTAKSSIRTVFPRWATHLNLDPVDMVGIDLPLHADPALYRSVVEFIKQDPQSRGALVTTHKLDLYAATHDLFDVIDPHASAMGEISSISKRNGLLVGHAKDPISSGLALDSFVPPNHFATTGASLLCLGAGGSAIAISWYLSRSTRGADRPGEVIITNRSAARLAHIQAVHEQLGVAEGTRYVLAPTTDINDEVTSALPRGSLVVNATGLGKDAPGSPIGDSARFPRNGLAWELNYRGDLVFLAQARAQQSTADLTVEDGWTYFLHGWTQVIAEVFDIEIPTSGPQFDALSALARGQEPAV